MDLLKEIDIVVNDIPHKVAVSKCTPSTTLNTFLREELLLTGTKKMCEEGGCGVCTVVRKKDHPQEYLAVNSCLISILSCQGWNIYTIEGVGNSNQKHVIQERLIKFNGSQCGFCTPGMVMNMYALQQNELALSMADIENSFGGNLCRCTGYRPILAAFKSLCMDASPDLTGCIPDIEDLSRADDFKCRPTNSEKKLTSLANSDIRSPFHFLFPRETWIRVYDFNDLLRVMKTFNGPRICTLVAGNTAKGVYKHKIVANVYVDISDIGELRGHKINENFLVLGANVTLTNAMKTFRKLSITNKLFQYLRKVAEHIDLVATIPIRNIGTLAGNLMIKHNHPEFPSDIFLVLETCDAKLEIVDTDGNQYLKSPQQFLQLEMSNKVIRKMLFRKLSNLEYNYGSYKIMPRSQNAHALQNAGFLFHFEQENNKLRSARIVYGHVNKKFVHASKTEQFLSGKHIFDNGVLQSALKILATELECESILPEARPDFRKKLAISLFYKYILSIAPNKYISTLNLSGRLKLTRPISKATHDYDIKECIYPLARGISKVEAKYHVTGEAEYIMDKPNYSNQLFASFVSTKARPGSKVINIDITKAMNIPGVIAFFGEKSIPGKNTFTPLGAGLFSSEEKLFCSNLVEYYHQPVGIIVGTTHAIAQTASELVEIEYKVSTKKPIVSIINALENGDQNRISKIRVVKPSVEGQLAEAGEVSGIFSLSWQYHYHMETQCCSAVPTEDGINLYPSSQWMDLSQHAAATVLNIPANKINVSVKRVGGGFGAKIIRNSFISSAAALACYLLKKPVKMWLPLETNMNIIGKRSPVYSKYKVLVNEEGVIQSLENKVYYDHGNANNECVINEFFHLYLETYNTKLWHSEFNVVHTDTPTACYTRAPGSAEALSMVEAIMEHTAMELGIDPLKFRLKNLNKDKSKLLEHINDLIQWAEINERKSKITEFNQKNRWRKKGISVVPMTYPFHLVFGYGVIVSIYHIDGSVAVAHGGVEIGQGINTKVVETCAFKLGIPVEQITVKPSNNLIAPNASMTGASLTSESVCWGVIKACDILLERMEPIKKCMPNASWRDLIEKCHQEFVNLCATSMFQGPKEEDLEPYNVYGVCASEIELDILTGQYQVTRVDLLEDVGDSMNPAIDIGQVEGAFVMGLGYFCTEQILIDEEGKIMTNRTWNYKPPGAKDIPIDFRVKFPKKNPNNVGVLKSKGSEGILPCFCAGSCPNGESEGTCFTKPGGKCFTIAEKVIENEKEEVLMQYGCLPATEMSFLQCESTLKHKNTDKVVECCDTHDFCNKFLMPSFRQPEEHERADINLHLAIVSVVLTLAGFVVLIVCLIKQNAKRNNMANPEAGTVSEQNSVNLETIVTCSSQTTFRERTIIDDISFDIRIAEGKYTEIWRGRWRDDPVAIKIFSKNAEKEWRNEVDIFQTPMLKHNNLLAYVASSKSDINHMHIITDYHSSGCLRNFLKKNTVNQFEVVEMIKGLASALNYLHMEIIASNIKPRIAHNNINSKSILVMENKQCCFCDLSQAKKFSVSDNVDSVEHVFNADIRYLAPEYLNKTFDSRKVESFMRADIYSFSLIIWEILNRCEDSPRIVNTTYKIPYEDELKNENLELSLDSLDAIVVSRNIKPQVNLEWDNYERLKEIRKVMEECWNCDKSIRPTSLRVKKNVLKIQEQNKVMEEKISI